MIKGSIAIISDSSCDIPKEYTKKHKLFILPLHVNMPEGNFLDGVNIDPEDIYTRMPKVIPTTSQPSPGDIKQLIEQIKSEGYKEAIAVCISSGLSGTFDVMSMCANDEKDLTIHCFDSKRLSMALGLIVMQAVEMNENGSTSEEILKALNSSWENTNAYFCMPTLSYLIKGGRIGLVSGTIGTLLGIIPTIAINDEGKYFTYAKTRGYMVAINKIEETIKELIKGKILDIAVMQGDAIEVSKKLYSNLKKMSGLRNIYLSHVSPALGVHTGPGLIGVAYRIVG